MKIYTKTGDQGETGLFAGPRVRKDHPRIEAFGTVDELNAALGMVRCETLPDDMDMLLDRVQGELFAVGADLATPHPKVPGTAWVGADHVKALEEMIDQYEAQLPRLTQFILPAGTPVCSALHFARAVCRRAERRVVTLANEPNERISKQLIAYLNRLSDLLFVLSRTANAKAGRADIVWERPP